MFLAVTSQLCQEIAVVPLLWMLPLALYLLSFVLCFEYGRFYHREGFLALLLVVGGMGTLALYGARSSARPGRCRLLLRAPRLWASAATGSSPGSSRRLGTSTDFYIVIAAGGAAGGVFTGIVAPQIFPAFFELHLALLAGPVALLLAIASRRHSWLHRGPRPLVWALRCFRGGLGARARPGPRDPRRGHVPGSREDQSATSTASCECPPRRGDGGEVPAQARPDHPRPPVRLRQRRREATSYYGPRTGIGLALDRHPRRLAGQPLRVGGVGLGVGTIAAYSRPGDTSVFYEINPAVIALSEGPAPTFTYLATRRRVVVVPGDARLALEREAPREFDVLAVDAFSSDAIPVHLLTREALGLYLSTCAIPRASSPSTSRTAISISSRWCAASRVRSACARRSSCPGGSTARGLRTGSSSRAGRAFSTTPTSPRPRRRCRWATRVCPCGPTPQRSAAGDQAIIEESERRRRDG